MVLTLAKVSSPNALIKRGLASLSITSLRISVDTAISGRTTEFSCETRETNEDRSRVFQRRRAGVWFDFFAGKKYGRVPVRGAKRVI